VPRNLSQKSERLAEKRINKKEKMVCKNPDRTMISRYFKQAEKVSTEKKDPHYLICNCTGRTREGNWDRGRGIWALVFMHKVCEGRKGMSESQGGVVFLKRKPYVKT